MRTSLVTVFAVLLGLLSSGTILFADESATPPGMAKYVMVLWRHGSPLPGNPSPGNAKKVEEPDIEKLGGKVLHKRDNQRVIVLPKQAARQLRKHAAVFLLQRLWVGESREEWIEDGSSGSRFSVETHSDTNLQWGPKSYTYDQSGNITAITPQGSSPDTYTYDTAGRLIRAVVGGQEETYEYDSFGNLIKTQRANSPAVNIPVDGGSNRLTGPEYDVAGNVLSMVRREPWTNGKNDFSWDGVNRLSYVRGPYTQRRMIYDVNDEKIATWILGGSEIEMHWTVRGLDGQPLREFTGTTNSFSASTWWVWQQDHVYGEGAVVGGETPTWGGNEILPEEFGGLRHLHLDHLGSVRLVTDDQHRSHSEHDYYPFGATQTPTHQEDFTFGHQVAPTIDSFRFAGHQRDFLGWTTGNTTEYLDYMHARVYDPHMGRFLSVDPTWESADLGKPQSWNRYAYVLNSPINRVDPDGKCSTAVMVTAFYLCGTIDLYNYVRKRGGQVREGVRSLADGRASTGERAMGAAVIGVVALEVGAIAIAAGEARAASAATTAVEAATTRGSATVIEHAGNHASVLVRSGNAALQTEQVVLSGGQTTIAVVENAAPAVRSVTVPVPDAAAAMRYQQSVVGQPTGTYNAATNSCVTHCGDVLRAGGVEAPSTTRSIIKWLRSLVGD